MAIAILTDSCNDLPLKYIKENKDILDMVGMPIHMDDLDFVDDMGVTVSHDQFYDKLRQGMMARTSQITPLDLMGKMKDRVEAGDEVIYFGLSSGLSGTFNNAVLAKSMLMEDMPEAKIHIVESRSASVGQGLMISHAIDQVRAGQPAETTAQWMDDKQKMAQHWFAVDDLHYLKNGGRIPAALAIIGTALKIKPVLTVGHNGKLESYSNIRGRKKSLKFLVEKVNEHVIDPEETRLVIGHGNCKEDADKLKGLIEEAVSFKEIMVTELSATIASHVGPNMIGLSFIGKEREQ